MNKVKSTVSEIEYVQSFLRSLKSFQISSIFDSILLNSFSSSLKLEVLVSSLDSTCSNLRSSTTVTHANVSKMRSGELIPSHFKTKITAINPIVPQTIIFSILSTYSPTSIFYINLLALNPAATPIKEAIARVVNHSTPSHKFNIDATRMSAHTPTKKDLFSLDIESNLFNLLKNLWILSICNYGVIVST